MGQQWARTRGFLLSIGHRCMEQYWDVWLPETRLASCGCSLPLSGLFENWTPDRSERERAGTQIPVIGNRWVAPTQRRPKTHPHPSVSKHTLGKKKQNTNRSMPLYSLKTLEVKSISFLSFKWCGRRRPWVGLPRWWWSAGCDCKAGNWRASSATANQR